MREISIEGCPVIGTGTFGKVYRIDADTVVKVYDDPANLPLIETEQERSRRAFIKGIPTAIPFGIAKVGDMYGSMFELIEARNCSDFIASHPEKADKLIAEYADFIRKLHAVQSEAGEFPDAREVYLDYLECIKPYLPGDMYDGLGNFVKAVPQSYGLVHGDIQMKNIMLTNGEMLLIDMNTLSAGSELFEFAGLYRTYVSFWERNPANQEEFLGLTLEQSHRIYYGTAGAFGIDGDCRDIQILAWLRFLHVVMIELSSPDSFMVAPTLDTLRRLLSDEDIH